MPAGKSGDQPVDEKEVMCPWCGEVTAPLVYRYDGDRGGVTRRSCSACGRVLAAYLEREGSFFSRIRRF